ncbi:MAG: hypothetical protein IKF51_08715 [Solobacterium sp.]|nr:hypothetical protein [Solobacterium sp.]
MYLDKMKSTANILSILVKIAGVLLWIGAGLIVVLAGLTLVMFRSDIWMKMLEQAMTIQVQGFTLTVDQLRALDPTALRSWFLMVLAAGLIMIILSILEVQTLSRVLERVKEGRPFDLSVQENLRKLGTLVIISGVLGAVIQPLSNRMMMRIADLSQIFNTETVSNVTLNFRLDLKFVISALVIFLLSHVAAYGRELENRAHRTETAE